MEFVRGIKAREDGGVEIVQKYYKAGSLTIAENTITGGTATLNWILSDQVNSTTVTANADGTLNSEIRYTAFGEIRASLGATPTQYRYTGQLADSYIKLSWYNSRWYDSQTAQFVQPDSIIPGWDNSDVPIDGYAWDHYAYVDFNSINHTDPTGHCYNTSSACLDYWTQYSLYAYGVKLKGNDWDSNLEYEEAAYQAVKDVGTMLSNYTGGSSLEAFRKTYSEGVLLEIGSCTACKGAGGYTHNSHWIEFAKKDPFFIQTEGRTADLAFEMNVHEVVHELGHAFASIGSWYDKNNALHLRSNSPYSKSFPSSRFLTDAGFATGPDYTNPWMWRMHPDQGEGVVDDTTRAHEAFADMFLGFTYDTWDSGQMGQARAQYMSTNMAGWIP